jgi:hypothetical protein
MRFALCLLVFMFAFCCGGIKQSVPPTIVIDQDQCQSLYDDFKKRAGLVTEQIVSEQDDVVGSSYQSALLECMDGSVKIGYRQIFEVRDSKITPLVTCYMVTATLVVADKNGTPTLVSFSIVDTLKIPCSQRA